MGEFELQKIAKLEQELALYKQFDKTLADKIDPVYFANLLSTWKWRPYDYPVKDILVFQWYEDDDLKYQVMLPCSRKYSDYATKLLEAAKAFAAFRNLDLKQVLVDLVLNSTNANLPMKKEPLK